MHIQLLRRTYMATRNKVCIITPIASMVSARSYGYNCVGTATSTSRHQLDEFRVGFASVVASGVRNRWNSMSRMGR